MTIKHLVLSIAETARISAPTLIEGVTGKLTPEDCDQRLTNWSARLLRQAKIDLRVQGAANAPAKQTFVVMSNHQSVYDIPVLFQALKRRLRMVAKRELFMIPGWGRAMRLAGFVEVDRKDRARAIASLEHAKRALAHGTNIWIAPEGTRGPGQGHPLLPFKQGGFHLAIATSAPILPVSIDGTSRVLSAHGRTVHEGIPVLVTIHPPIAAGDYGEARREELVVAVRGAIESGLSG
jgi:1-acyl-sn-glycerol-3-phosphate acyltransferase